ncbi:putative non-specific lipid-transfer protein 14, partial [Phtheirospermum japonicum]
VRGISQNGENQLPRRRFHCRGDGGDSPLAILADDDCATVTALVSAFSSFVTYGSPDPIPGSSCCVAMTSLNNLADSGDNHRAVCRCVMDLIAAYSSNTIATMPGFCGVSL